MKNNKKDVLPLGSVVLLKEATRYIVIVGYSMRENGENKIWDYLGCAYPMGVISNDSGLLFDREQIEKVVFNGFTDEEGDAFRKQINVSIGDEE